MIGHGLFGAIEAALSVDRYHPKDPALARLFGLGNSTNSGVRVDHEKMLAIPAIFRAASIISNGVARAPYYIYKKDSKIGENREYATGHTSWHCVTSKPNDEITQVNFRRTMTVWAMLWGNAIAKIDAENWPLGGKVELIPLLPDRTYPVRIDRNMVKRYNVDENLLGKLYYTTTIDDQEVSYPADSCLHIRGLGKNPYWGIDIASALKEAIGGSIAKTEFGHRFYGQGANPSGWVEMPGSLDEESEERFVDSIRRATEGMQKAHRVAVLEEGAKFHQWTVDPEKAQFLEGLELDYRIIANVIGIKVHKLIDSANSSYNSLESANAEHRDDDLFPWLLQWKSEMHDKLLTGRQKETGTHEIDLDDQYLDGWVPYKERAEAVVLLHNNDMLERDEGRRKLNLPPSTDGHGKKYVMPMNMEFTDNKAAMADILKQSAISPPAKTAPGPAKPVNPAEPEDDETDDESEDGSDDKSSPKESATDGIVWDYSVESKDRGIVLIDGKEIPAIACNSECALVYKRTDDGYVVAGETEIVYGKITFIPQEVIAPLKQQVTALESAWLLKIQERLGKQATKIAAKGLKEFDAWVGRLSTEHSPKEIQAKVDRLYADVKRQLGALVSDGICTDSNLQETVKSLTELWKVDNE